MKEIDDWKKNWRLNCFSTGHYLYATYGVEESPEYVAIVENKTNGKRFSGYSYDGIRNAAAAAWVQAKSYELGSAAWAHDKKEAERKNNFVHPIVNESPTDTISLSSDVLEKINKIDVVLDKLEKLNSLIISIRSK